MLFELVDRVVTWSAKAFDCNNEVRGSFHLFYLGVTGLD
jgi:hypothetical protein